MPRITRRDLLVTAMCGAWSLAVYFANVRHAGYYIAAAIFVGGLLIGVRAVAAVFVVAALLGAGWFVYATVHHVADPDGDARAYAFLFATILPALASVPAVAGAGVRWAFLARSGRGPALRPPRIESPVALAFVVLLGLAGLFVWGYYALLAAALVAVVLSVRPHRP